MKIAIPVNDERLESEVCPSFGRTPSFMVYDSSSTETTFIENSAANSPGGAGIKAAQLIVDNNIDVLLTPRCGENAGEVLIPANVKIYKTTASCAKDNIEAFLAGELQPLEQFHAGFHGVQG